MREPANVDTPAPPAPEAEFYFDYGTRWPDAGLDVPSDDIPGPNPSYFTQGLQNSFADSMLPTGNGLDNAETYTEHRHDASHYTSAEPGIGNGTTNLYDQQYTIQPQWQTYHHNFGVLTTEPRRQAHCHSDPGSIDPSLSSRTEVWRTSHQARSRPGITSQIGDDNDMSQAWVVPRLMNPQMNANMAESRDRASGTPEEANVMEQTYMTLPEPWSHVAVVGSSRDEDVVYADVDYPHSDDPTNSLPMSVLSREHESVWLSSAAETRTTDTSVDPKYNDNMADSVATLRPDHAAMMHASQHESLVLTEPACPAAFPEEYMDTNHDQDDSLGGPIEDAVRYVETMNIMGRRLTSCSDNVYLHVPQNPVAAGPPSPTLSAMSIASSNVPDPLVCRVKGCTSTQFTGKYRRGNYQRHMRLKHGREVRLYPCAVWGCENIFKRQDARLKHYRIRHPDHPAPPRMPRSRMSDVRPETTVDTAMVPLWHDT